MTQTATRGNVVLAPDPYSSDGRLPIVIISNEEYPFYPHGYLGIPVTTHNKPNTVKIHEYDKVTVKSDLHVNPSYINPWSPFQVNEIHRELLTLSDEFCDRLGKKVAQAVGVEP